MAGNSFSLDRRGFFAALTATSACGWLFASDASAQTSNSGYDNSVPLTTGSAPAESDAYFSINQQLTATNQAATFPQSVASGDPRSNGIVLWTRVDPSAIISGAPLMWQIAASPDFSSMIVSGAAVVDSSRDNTVKLPVSAAQLQPYTTYFYRFIYNNVASRTGRFKTLPAPNANVTSLRLAYVVCQDYGNGYYTALQHLAQEQVDFVVHLGDYIYETIAAPSFQNNPVRTVPPFPSGSATFPQDLGDYRHLYRVYRSDPNQQAVHENFAYIQLWDDHEFANDCHQDFHPDNNSNPDAPTPALRQAANQAWSEYGLADVVFDGTKSWENSIQLYRKFQFGTLMDLIVTDERLYRDGPPCGNNQLFERYFSPGCAALHDSSRTMLGASQRQWFLQQVTSSTATWKIWANEVMLMPLKVAGAVYVDLDQWDGYPAERSAILAAIGQANVKNFVAITGDLHTFLAGYLKRDFSNLFQSPVGVELMVGSISSANLAEEIEAGVHLPSCPVPALNFGVPPNLLEPLIRVNNPHVEYWDSSTHGYATLDISPTRLVCTFQAVTTIKQPTANLVRLRTFTVPAGQAKLEQS